MPDFTNVASLAEVNIQLLEKCRGGYQYSVVGGAADRDSVSTCQKMERDVRVWDVPHTARGAVQHTLQGSMTALRGTQQITQFRVVWSHHLALALVGKPKPGTKVPDRLGSLHLSPGLADSTALGDRR
jgi:hypothetical protein